MDLNNIIQQLSIWLIPVLFAITLHEVSHGLVALYFGDRTAQMLGRLSLNPIRHIDLVGTIVVPIITFSLGGFIFGWAKPVPITPQNLSNPKADMLWVALAGPAANLLMAIFWVIIIKIMLSFFLDFSLLGPIVLMAKAGIIINIILMIFNLLPIPSFDGSRILESILPNKYSWYISRLEPYGIFIVLGLLSFGLLDKIISPLFKMVIKVFYSFAGIN